MSQCIFKVYFCQKYKLLLTGHGFIIPGRFHPSTHIQSLVRKRQMATTCAWQRDDRSSPRPFACVLAHVCLFRLLTCQNRNHSLLQEPSVRLSVTEYNEIPLVTEAFGYYRNKYLQKREQRFILFSK